MQEKSLLDIVGARRATTSRSTSQNLTVRIGVGGAKTPTDKGKFRGMVRSYMADNPGENRSGMRATAFKRESPRTNLDESKRAPLPGRQGRELIRKIAQAIRKIQATPRNDSTNDSTVKSPVKKAQTDSSDAEKVMSWLLNGGSGQLPDAYTVPLKGANKNAGEGKIPLLVGDKINPDALTTDGKIDLNKIDLASLLAMLTSIASGLPDASGQAVTGGEGDVGVGKELPAGEFVGSLLGLTSGEGKGLSKEDLAALAVRLQAALATNGGATDTASAGSTDFSKLTTEQLKNILGKVAKQAGGELATNLPDSVLRVLAVTISEVETGANSHERGYLDQLASESLVRRAVQSVVGETGTGEAGTGETGTGETGTGEAGTGGAEVAGGVKTTDGSKLSVGGESTSHKKISSELVANGRSGDSQPNDQTTKVANGKNVSDNNPSANKILTATQIGSPDSALSANSSSPTIGTNAGESGTNALVALDGGKSSPQIPVTPEAQNSPQSQVAHNIERIEQALRLAVKRGIQRVTMQLNPAHLGRVTVRMEMRGGVVTASVQADSTNAKNFLASGIQQLRESLAGQGISLEQFDVGTHSDGNPGDQAGFGQRSNTNSNDENTRGFGRDDNDWAEDKEVAPVGVVATAPITVGAVPKPTSNTNETDQPIDLVV